MPTVRVSSHRSSAFNTSQVYVAGKHPSVTIYQVASPFYYLTLPFAPVEVDYGDRAPEYAEIQRPSVNGLLVYKRPKLKTLTMSVMVAKRSNPGGVSVEDKLKKLELIASLPVNLHIVGYGPSIDPKMNFRLTDLSYTSTFREQGTNKILKAQVNLQFTQAPKFVSDVAGMDRIYYQYRGPTTPSSRTTDQPGDAPVSTFDIRGTDPPVGDPANTGNRAAVGNGNTPLPPTGFAPVPNPNPGVRPAANGFTQCGTPTAVNPRC